jgi:nucleoid DNA-binding protein
MRKVHRGALAALTLTLVGLLALTAPVWSQLTVKEPARPEKASTLRGRLAKVGDVSEEKIDAILKELGPAIADQLARGEKIEMRGLGTFRVVRIPEHRDLVSGRPAIIAARNYVEFLPTGSLVEASNAPGAVPQETVTTWQFDPMRGQEVPFERAPSSRFPGQKIR